MSAGLLQVLVSDEERLNIPLAVGLFAEGTISLAKAARLSGMTRYEFAALLNTKGLPGDRTRRLAFV